MIATYPHHVQSGHLRLSETAAALLDSLQQQPDRWHSTIELQQKAGIEHPLPYCRSQLDRLVWLGLITCDRSLKYRFYWRIVV